MNLFKSENESGIKSLNIKKYLAELFLAVAIIAMIFIIPFSSKAYATEEYWALNIGNKTVAYLNSESEANQVIKEVEKSFTKKGATDVSVSLDPQMSVEQKFFHTDEIPTTETVAQTKTKILKGNKEVVTYTIKNGDTLWSISEEQKISLKELKSLNGLKDSSLIKPGDKVKLNATVPLVTVKTTQTVTVKKTIEYKTKYVKDSSLAKGTTKVKTKGKNGSKNVTETLTMNNDKIVKTKVLKTKVTKKSKTKVVLKGTKVKKPATTDTSASNTGSTSAKKSTSRSSASSDSTTYAGSGSAVANYALQFVGNPYVYGGSSLTNGADCSGFVMAVYSHFGVSLPHNARTQGYYGRAVSAGDLQPGDLVGYGYHIGIYIGGGRMVHASNENTGIIVTSTGYSGSPIAYRRILE